MKLAVTSKKWKSKEIEALIVPIASKESVPQGLPTLASQLLTDAIKRKEFSGLKGEMVSYVMPVAAGQTLRHVVFVGIGKPGHLDMVACAKMVGQVMRSVQAMKVLNVGFWLRDVLVSTYPQAEQFGELLASYAVMSVYEFEEYRRKKATKIKALTLYIENKKEEAAVSRGVQTGSIIGRITNESRNLGNHPGNVATPVHLAKFMREQAEKEPTLNVKVLGEGDMEKEKMGLILGVASGSDQEAQFIVVEYWGADKKEAPYVIIGKGVTFDSGGISIKPAPAMDEMKFDMCGAAAAFGVIRCAAALKLKLNVVCLVPAAENLIGPKAYKPGDILTASDGTTVEIMNTDAEGRLLVADALVYARQYKPAAVIDLATLTGAVVIALHDIAAGLFTQDPKLADELKKTGEQTGDAAWPLPMPDEFREHIRSKTADIMNLAAFRWGDAITGATFLNHFVDGRFPWAHLDIAGVAWATGGKKHLAPGATGGGTRLVLQYLRNQVKQA